MPTWRHAVGRLVNPTRGFAATPDLVLRLDIEMVEETARLAPYSACAHVCVVLFVAMLFWPLGAHVYLCTLCLGVIGSCAVALALALAAKSASATRERLTLAKRLAALTAIALSAAWSTSPFMLFLPSDTSHRLLLASIMAGLISNAMVLGPIPLITVSFMAPIVVSSTSACLLAGDPVIALTAALDVIYSVYVLLNVLMLSRQSRNRVLDRVKAEEQSALISLLLRDFEESSSDWLWEIDAAKSLRHVSKRFAEVAGRDREAMRGVGLRTMLDEIAAPTSRVVVASLLRTLDQQASFRDLVIEVNIGADRSWWSLSGKPKFDGGGVFTGYRGVGADITSARRSEARVSFLARHDALTGLPNRVSLGEALEGAVGGLQRAGPAETKRFALLLLDLDQFKVVNDTLGHTVGDELLAEVARRLRATVPERALVARLGGDEFAILCPGKQEADAARLGDRIVSTLSLPYRIDARQVMIGASVGITLAPHDAADATLLMKYADMALYQAKGDGRGCVRFFNREMEAQTRRRRLLESDLKRALDRGELSVDYQPIVAAGHLGISGFEALMRWHHSTLGEVAPAAFIPAAESTGLIVSMGAWVLSEACREAARWPAAIRIAVNISPVQIAHGDLVERVQAAIAASGLDPTRLELEMTESIFLEATPETQSTLARLRAIGVKFALDDFGTGYSSLSYLSQFAFDKIKIDRSFVRDLETRREAGAVVQAIVTLGLTLGVTLNAEGIETLRQLRRLEARGCNELQGFLFSPAVTAERAALMAGMARHELPWSEARGDCEEPDFLAAE